MNPSESLQSFSDSCWCYCCCCEWLCFVMLNKHVVYYGVGSWRRLQRNTFFWFPNTKYLEIQFMYICLWVCPRMCAIFFTLRKLPSQQHFIGDFSLGTCQFLWHSKCLLLDNWNVFISVFFHAVLRLWLLVDISGCMTML